MEERRRVNLSQFRSPKKNKRFLVKFAFYAIVLGVLSLLIMKRLRDIEPSAKNQHEIHDVRIELP